MLTLIDVVCGALKSMGEACVVHVLKALCDHDVVLNGLRMDTKAAAALLSSAFDTATSMQVCFDLLGIPFFFPLST